MDGLKQRIIGALVLVSLAVIFVPMVFDEPHSERTSTTINIPEEPPFPEVEAPVSDVAPPPPYQQDEPATADSGVQDYRILESDESALQPVPDSTANPEPQATESVQTEPAPSPSVSPTTAAAPQEKPSAPAQTEPSAQTEQESAEFTRSLEGAWVVQLGSFGNGDNARRLRDKVREKGYNSHLQEVVRGDSTLTRVFSGPFAEKTEAESAKRALDKAFSLNSLVTSGDK
ncbi:MULTISPECIES: SPOR domain-containing protein [unclassified Marinobacter]|uniref:SPOR domain-containing protein n=1 Tax=unclassified Marinobacter TaxID=83889 RepID=UPI0026E33673|nr:MULTISPECIES: SPOR domain-containing protein [unclassified Marinobacter]MDO6442445.1 SPOR domain-containing protein [Marinobacter sp. 2_MG-2023]MDO6824501.1 SPOR domain-containing protein [Marinobacter sp. 1_MG-2023]